MRRVNCEACGRWLPRLKRLHKCAVLPPAPPQLCPICTLPTSNPSGLCGQHLTEPQTRADPPGVL